MCGALRAVGIVQCVVSEMCSVQCSVYSTCLFIRLESLALSQQVSDSSVSAETVIYETFVLMGEIG